MHSCDLKEYSSKIGYQRIIWLKSDGNTLQTMQTIADQTQSLAEKLINHGMIRGPSVMKTRVARFAKVAIFCGNTQTKEGSHEEESNGASVGCGMQNVQRIDS